jgi:hypothetical protein
MFELQLARHSNKPDTTNLFEPMFQNIVPKSIAQIVVKKNRTAL